MTALLKSFQLKNLSDNELLSQLHALSKKEKETTLDVLLSLTEVDNRRLYLSRGFGSLFDYCTRGLGYSESAALRRIRAARVIRDYPDFHALVEEGHATITTLSLIAGVIGTANHRQLYWSVGGKRQREVEAIVERYRPKKAVRDRVRPVAVVGASCEPGLFDRDAGDVPLNDSHREECNDIYRHWRLSKNPLPALFVIRVIDRFPRDPNNLRLGETRVSHDTLIPLPALGVEVSI